jgi:versiconal hemiacetal acetate esterase
LSSAINPSYISFLPAQQIQVTQNASKHGASPSKIFTIGQSAGGNMAIMVALKIAASSDPSRVKGVVALGPPTVNPNAIPSHLKDQFNFAENADSAIIDTNAMALYSSSYGAPADSPDVSVLLSKDLGKLPPTYLVVTDKDPTRDDGLVFEKEAKKAGVKIKMDFYEGFPHMFWLIPGMKEGDKWAGNLVEGLKWVVANMSS